MEDQNNDYETIYLPEVLLVGNIVKLQDFRQGIQEKKQDSIYMMAHFKSTYDNGGIKYIILKKADYKNNFVKNFNRMMKNKN